MDSISKQLKQINKSINDEVGDSVTFEQLFDEEFMDKNTDHSTIAEFFQYHGFVIRNAEDFEAIDQQLLNDAVTKSTCFGSWEQMCKQAGTNYLARELIKAGFDISY
jgi:hypothetical protein